MVDRKIKLELDTSILRKEIAKTEAISDSDYMFSLMIQGFNPKPKEILKFHNNFWDSKMYGKWWAKSLKEFVITNSKNGFYFKTFSNSMQENVAFCQFFMKK